MKNYLRFLLFLSLCFIFPKQAYSVKINDANMAKIMSAGVIGASFAVNSNQVGAAGAAVIAGCATSFLSASIVRAMATKKPQFKHEEGPFFNSLWFGSFITTTLICAYFVK